MPLEQPRAEPAVRLRLDDAEGNIIAEDEQWAKMKLVADVAQKSLGLVGAYQFGDALG